jgi:hypothetical protein
MANAPTSLGQQSGTPARDWRVLPRRLNSARCLHLRKLPRRSHPFPAGRVFNERVFLHGLQAVAARAANLSPDDPRSHNLLHVAGSFALHRWQHLSPTGAWHGAKKPGDTAATWQPDDVDVWIADASLMDALVTYVEAALLPRVDGDVTKPSLKPLRPIAFSVPFTGSRRYDVDTTRSLYPAADIGYKKLRTDSANRPYSDVMVEPHERGFGFSYTKAEAKASLLNKLGQSVPRHVLDKLLGDLPAELGTRSRPYSIAYCHETRTETRPTRVLTTRRLAPPC